MSQTLTAASLHTPAKTWANPVITIDNDGIIQSIESAASSPDTTILVSTFLDVHTHGAVNHDVMEGTPEALNKIGRFLATRGVGHFLPTTVTAGLDRTLRGLEGIANQIEQPTHDGAIPLGIHLEGPFISHAKRGVHPPPHILPPSIELFDRFQQAARGHIRLITIAPEIPGAIDLIAHAHSKGVKVSLGHSNATAAEARAGITAGATTATHTYNAMRALDHREPGILGVVLDDDNLFAELICDGIHVAPEIVRLYLKAKGVHRAMLITDSMAATGMPEGTYMLGDLVVQVADGRAMSDGALAGSVLTLDRAVANFSSFTGLDLPTTVNLASINPARMLGVDDHLTVAVGKPCNLNRYTAEGTLHSTLLRGRQVS